MRLNRYIARCGVSSRRRADQLIQEGRISVNNQLVTELGYKVDSDQDNVFLDNQLIKPIQTCSYILFNKPARVLTTVKDPQNRPTVMDYLPQIPGMVPVGRLDYDTEGVLLCTNDGELAYRLSHPRYKVDKVYLAQLDRPINSDVIEQLQEGVEIGEKNPARASKVEHIDAHHIRVVLHEGRKRQIKRMLHAFGYKVLYLRREQFAFLKCDDLEKSSWRYLNQKEIHELKKLVRLSNAD